MSCHNNACKVSPPRRLREVVREPTPEPIITRVVIRAPTPEPEIIEVFDIFFLHMVLIFFINFF
jgi:hypothetical protein